MSNLTRKRYDSLLFQYETTNKNDFRYGAIKEYPKTIYKPKPSHHVRGKPVYKHIHTMVEWKGTMPPADLMITHKAIVRTHPGVVQKAFSKPIDDEREDAQKSRPRLVMTPSVSMDDIDDPTARNILCSDMYRSQMSRDFVPFDSTSQDIKAQRPGLPAPANPDVNIPTLEVNIRIDSASIKDIMWLLHHLTPQVPHSSKDTLCKQNVRFVNVQITLAKLQPPLVSPEWRMETVSWDLNQLRTYSDYTRDFWLSQTVPGCRACDETAIVKKHRKMTKEMKK